jgi:hypothetical protein
LLPIWVEEECGNGSLLPDGVLGYSLMPIIPLLQLLTIPIELTAQVFIFHGIRRTHRLIGRR